MPRTKEKTKTPQLRFELRNPEGNKLSLLALDIILLLASFQACAVPGCATAADDI